MDSVVYGEGSNPHPTTEDKSTFQLLQQVSENKTTFLHL